MSNPLPVDWTKCEVWCAHMGSTKLLVMLRGEGTEDEAFARLVRAAFPHWDGIYGRDKPLVHDPEGLMVGRRVYQALIGDTVARMFFAPHEMVPAFQVTGWRGPMGLGEAEGVLRGVLREVKSDA